jgi:hypothetical protein
MAALLKTMATQHTAAKNRARKRSEAKMRLLDMGESFLFKIVQLS